MASLLILTALTTVTTALPRPGTDPLSDTYSIALANAPPLKTREECSGSQCSYGNPGVDVGAGASGDSGSFELSNGAIAAIATVCAVVVVFGIASAILFYIAKKRQWALRSRMKHASRRLTARARGKPPPATQAEIDRKSRRQGAMRLQEKYKSDRGIGKPAPVAKAETDRSMMEREKDVDMTKREGRGDGRKAVAVLPPGAELK